MADKAEEAGREHRKAVEAQREHHEGDERQPLIASAFHGHEAGSSSTPFPTAGGSGPATGTATPTHAERPRTVRHHRRTLSGRSVRSEHGHFQFGPSFHPGIYPAHNDPFSRQAKRAADARARSRFIKAFAIGAGVWLLIGVIAGWTGFQELNGRGRLDYGARPAVPPSEGSPFACANFTRTTNPRSPAPKGYSTSTAEFHIPVSKDDLFFVHGQGSFAKGNVYFDVVDSGAKEAAITVEAVYNDHRLVDLMQVCDVRKQNRDDYSNGREIGLGIYTPAPEVGPYPDSDLGFSVHIELPKNLMTIYTLEVRGPTFAIEASDLTDLDLERVDFESTSSHIAFQSVRAHAIRARTNNGAISGLFNVSSTLSLASTNGAIAADVILFPRSKQDDTLPELPPNPPMGDDSGGLKPLRGRDRIPRLTSEVTGTSVHATTTNGAVNLKYVEHPVGQVLWSHAASTNGRVTVSHTPGFEGDFEAETTWGLATVAGPEVTEDPSGKGRERKREIRTDREELGYRQIAGTVWWSGGKSKDDDRRERGDTVVKTTLGSAHIEFA